MLLDAGRCCLLTHVHAKLSDYSLTASERTVYSRRTQSTQIAVSGSCVPLIIFYSVEKCLNLG
jgi:hypothetical protein